MARLALRLNHTVKDDKEKWITVNGTHVPVGEGGKIEGGPAALKKESAKKNGGTKTVAKSLKSGKIGSTKRKIPLDSNGTSYTLPRARNISPKEHEKVRHEINTLFHTKFKDEPFGRITTYDPKTEKAYDYLFESHGFDEYNIYSKKLNRG